MGLKDVLMVVASLILIAAWGITYHTNELLIQQNEKLYSQVEACHSFLDSQ